jgi:Peptidase family M23
VSGRASIGAVWRIAAAVVAAWFIWQLAGTVSNAETTSALRVESAGPPQRVQGSDGREHMEYDLVVTNAFTTDARLDSLEVRSPGRTLLSLSGARLRASTLRLGTLDPTGGVVSHTSTVVIIVDVALRRSAGRGVPAQLSNRIVYSIPANAPLRPVIGTTTVHMPPLRVDRSRPVVIASPLRGTGWWSANGCCDDPSSPHRNVLLASSSGRYIPAEIFAIDWMRLVNGVMFTGDGSKNADYPTYGEPLYAVANGTVARVVDNRPDIPPRSKNPGLVQPGDFGGNQVLLKIGPGRYACYAHMQPGSVRVRRGQHVRAGQRIGLVGNSGNTTAPHLHFGIQRRPDCLSESEPFEIDRFTLQGMADPASPVPHVKLVGPRRRERHALPLILSVAAL